MSRCYGCSQENCGRTKCDCQCHDNAFYQNSSGSSRFMELSAVPFTTSVLATSSPPPEKCPCKKHRSYLARRKPRGNCEECWRFFIKMNPKEEE